MTVIAVILLNPAAIQTAYSFCDPSLDTVNGYSGTHQAATLPNYLNVPLRFVDTPAPYKYAGCAIMGVGQQNNSDYTDPPAYLTWLSTQPRPDDFDTDEAFV